MILTNIDFMKNYDRFSSPFQTKKKDNSKFNSLYDINLFVRFIYYFEQEKR
jgi:hypothetical protein